MVIVTTGDMSECFYCEVHEPGSRRRTESGTSFYFSYHNDKHCSAKAVAFMTKRLKRKENTLVIDHVAGGDAGLLHLGDDGQRDSDRNGQSSRRL